MQVSFFPRDKLFWICNLSGWGLNTIFATILGSRGSPTPVLTNVIVFSIFAVFGILAGLVFRKIYHLRRWDKSNIILLIVPTFSFAFIFSFLVTLITISIAWWLGPYMLPVEVINSPGYKYKYLLINNWVALLPVMFIWLLIYLMVVNYRRQQKTLIENIRLEGALKDAQINTLKGQLNPHFIFNGLNNIRSLIQEDTGRAREMIAVLSDVLRFSLDSNKKDKVPLIQELDTVNNFIQLAAIQFEERLQFEMHAPIMTYQLLFPPMMLQILVENAIKHGLSQLKYGGKLIIRIDDNSGRLECRVYNDGYLKSNFAKDDFGRTYGGLGLRNIRERLALLYGNAAQLNLRQVEDQVVAELLLPKETA